MKTSAKNKIILLLIGWGVVCALMFLYFFGFLNASNQKTIDGIDKQKSDLAVVQAEKNSYTQGKSDLEKLAEESLPLSSFFSRDITLVGEIQTLEVLSQKLGVTMQLGGVSGTASSAPKAEAKTAIVEIPYNIRLNGTLAQVSDFIENMEHLDFIIDARALSITAADKGLVNANFSGEFYIQN